MTKSAIVLARNLVVAILAACTMNSNAQQSWPSSAAHSVPLKHVEVQFSACNSATYMNYKTTWDLSTIPDKQLYAEVGKRNNARRTTHAGGRSKVLRPCQKCGAKLGAREMRQHTC